MSNLSRLFKRYQRKVKRIFWDNDKISLLVDCNDKKYLDLLFHNLNGMIRKLKQSSIDYEVVIISSIEPHLFSHIDRHNTTTKDETLSNGDYTSSKVKFYERREKDTDADVRNRLALYSDGNYKLYIEHNRIYDSSYASTLYFLIKNCETDVIYSDNSIVFNPLTNIMYFSNDKSNVIFKHMRLNDKLFENSINIRQLVLSYKIDEKYISQFKCSDTSLYSKDYIDTSVKQIIEKIYK